MLSVNGNGGSFKIFTTASKSVVMPLINTISHIFFRFKFSESYEFNVNTISFD